MTHEPTDEQANVNLMRLYALSGREAEGLTQYGRLEVVLAKELGTEPATTSRALREEIASGRLVSKGKEENGPTLSETPTGIGFHNLPAERSSFVGREREMLELKRALAMTRSSRSRGWVARARPPRAGGREGPGWCPPRRGVAGRARTPLRGGVGSSSGGKLRGRTRATRASAYRHARRCTA